VSTKDRHPEHHAVTISTKPTAHVLIHSDVYIRLHPQVQRRITLPATLQRLRIDRQLEEALAADGDPLQVAEVFGLSEDSAVRYGTNARLLLHESDGFIRMHHPADEPGGRWSRESAAQSRLGGIEASVSRW
jgi:hypothetical protein